MTKLLTQSTQEMKYRLTTNIPIKNYLGSPTGDYIERGAEFELEEVKEEVLTPKKLDVKEFVSVAQKAGAIINKEDQEVKEEKNVTTVSQNECVTQGGTGDFYTTFSGNGGTFFHCVSWCKGHKEMTSECPIVKEKEWPQEGDEYWYYISTLMGTTALTSCRYNNDDFDKKRFATNMVFRTQQEAQKAADYIRKVLINRSWE